MSCLTSAGKVKQQQLEYRFPNHHPDPKQETTLRLRHYVSSSNCRLEQTILLEVDIKSFLNQ